MYSEQGKKQMKRFKEILLTAVLASSTSLKKMVPVTNEKRVLNIILARQCLQTDKLSLIMFESIHI